MKFLYSDTQDYVDPGYDFARDRNAPGRKRYWDDRYAHEMMNPAPYDGLLVSMSAVRGAEGVPKSKVRYSTAEEQRLLRDGARAFLRFDGPRFKDAMIMGDCGAFAYADQPKPAYSVDEVLEFYGDAGFTHGCSPDHIIFSCDMQNPSRASQPSDVTDRFDVTLENAEQFLRSAHQNLKSFQPMGSVQGWSPESMAEASRSLEQMGFKYLAIGGLVPLKVDAIHKILRAIRAAIRSETKLHLLGFAKAEAIHEFVQYDVASFDSTSPLLRAFKDAKANYYMEGAGRGLEYYSAIRIPQALENSRLMHGIKRGVFSPEELQRKEERALGAIRQYDKGCLALPIALEILVDYQRFLSITDHESVAAQELQLAKQTQLMERTLASKPWQQCRCPICSDLGVEVIIFRSSNRNKRRGFHNLGVYHRHLQRTTASIA